MLTTNCSLLKVDTADWGVMNIGSTTTLVSNRFPRRSEAIRDQPASGVELEYDERFDAAVEYIYAIIQKKDELTGYEPTTTIREGAGEFMMVRDES